MHLDEKGAYPTPMSAFIIPQNLLDPSSQVINKLLDPLLNWIWAFSFLLSRLCRTEGGGGEKKENACWKISK